MLLILTDDVGFGAPSAFGGVIPTPALDRIAKMGLRYTQFHTTALCSPTRAALITGRNHHAVGFGVISELESARPQARALGGRGRARARAHTLEFDFRYDGLGLATLAFNNTSGVGRGGTGVLRVDGKVVATQKMERTIPITLRWDETFDVGADTGTPVDDRDYQVPFRFNGRLAKLTLTVDRPKLTPADEQRLMRTTKRD